MKKHTTVIANMAVIALRGLTDNKEATASSTVFRTKCCTNIRTNVDMRY